MTQVTIGAFYNPHLGKELAQADGIDHPALLRRQGKPDARAGVAASVLRSDGRRLPTRPAARLAGGALPRYFAAALARRVPPRSRGGATRRRCRARPGSRRSLDRARRAVG